MVFQPQCTAPMGPLTVCTLLCDAIAEIGILHMPWALVCCAWLLMEGIVDLAETSQGHYTQVPTDLDCDFQSEFVEEQAPASNVRAARVGGRGGSNSARSSSVPSQTRTSLPQKVRGPNWTEAEMLVLIGQKRIEWDGRHNCNQNSLAKFVYGTTAWKLVLAGCMGVVGFCARDTDQITNKWDGLIKDYKKLKEYIENTGSGNWWAMSREEKKQLSRTRKMSLEFSESMYNEMEGFVGKRQIFGRAADVVDSDRAAPPVARSLGRSPPTPRACSGNGTGSPISSATAASESPPRRTPGDDTPGSTGRKRKAVGTDNLVDFVKDFNFEHLSQIEAQDRDRQTWRSEVLAFNTAREAKIVQKENDVTNMDNKMFELEVERTRNLGNMTTALMMLASSMDALTRCSNQSCTLELLFPILVFVSFGGSICAHHYARALGNPICRLLPFDLQVKLALHSQGPLAWGA